MNNYRFLGAYAFSEPFEKQFYTDEEALQYRYHPTLADGRWYASVWKLVDGEWLYWNDDTRQWAKEIYEMF
jgi:hypothetical protein